MQTISSENAEFENSEEFAVIIKAIKGLPKRKLPESFDQKFYARMRKKFPTEFEMDELPHSPVPHLIMGNVYPIEVKTKKLFQKCR